MSEAFNILNIPFSATNEQIHAAYIKKVKDCHPDRFLDLDEQIKAQEKLVQLNIAYKEAIELTKVKNTCVTPLTLEEAKDNAKKMLKNNSFNNALIYLNRSKEKDDEWYYIHGQVLMQMQKFDDAHTSFRKAVSLEPNKKQYRQSAFDAAILLKNNNNLHGKIGFWIKNAIKNKFNNIGR